jgi:pimeloyl-ACP methyl ester carboxylesterase
LIMATFVLLHGAWHGGWCWSRVAPRLRAEGHDVFTPTFTGLSDRAHLLARSVGLSVHVEDVVRLLDAEDLAGVVLVGHSYAGLVVSSVAEQRPERLGVRVYLDAFLPRDGECGLDLFPPSVARHYRDTVADAGFGWLIPALSLEMLGVESSVDMAWVQPRLTPQPWATYLDRVQLGQREQQVPGAFIECTDGLRLFRPQRERAFDLGWPLYELATGHEAMVTAPDALSDVLLRIESS